MNDQFFLVLYPSMEEDALYGPFKSEEEALEWLHKHEDMWYEYTPYKLSPFPPS